MLGLYCRVSTRKQQEKGLSLEVQEKAGKEFARRLAEPSELYIEAKSAKDINARDEWLRLQSDIVSGKIDAVWVYDTSRLARNAEDENLIHATMVAKNVRYYPGGTLVDFTDPPSWFNVKVQGLTNEFFRLTLVKKTRAGLAQSISNGRHAARRLIGYALPTEKGVRMRTVIPEQAKLVQRIFKMFNEGMSLRRLTDTINGQGYRTVEGNLFTRTTVRRIIENPRFTGRQPSVAHWKHDGEGKLIPSQSYPKIIEPLVWQEAQRNLKQGTARGFSAKAAHMSTALLICSSCKARYHYHPAFSHKNRYPVYLHHRTGKDCGQRPLSIIAPYLDAVFSIVYLTAIRDTESVRKMLAKEAANIDRERAQIERDVQRIDTRIEDLEKQRQRIVSAISHGVMTEGDAATEMLSIKTELAGLEKAKADNRHELALKSDRNELLLREFSADRFFEFIDDGAIDEHGEVVREATTGRQRRDMIRRIMDSAVITGRSITIKMASGRMFSIEYLPRLEEKAVKYLAEQAEINPAKLKKPTLENLLAKLKRSGRLAGTRTYVDVWNEGVKHGKD